MNKPRKASVVHVQISDSAYGLVRVCVTTGNESASFLAMAGSVVVTDNRKASQ